ncbi:FAD-dependent oxidoreductase [Ramlibacter rhizophilus]|uniref:FAD-dependent oxidoreductase n=1 Tax=Ramlibacter rhizophilus TaxID=1781167 RepID=UPI0014324F86|nr:FAD-dependent oxidoreductase [Ramlibacter rhizophilus]
MSGGNAPGSAARKRLVLAGAGHAHALVLRSLARAPLPQVELVVVAPQPLAPYSGMVPGWLDGRYAYEDIVIDFAALCRAAGARFVPASLHALDTEARVLTLDTGERLSADLLSLNVGSTLRAPRLDAAEVLALRPLPALRRAYEALTTRWAREPASAPALVAAVGGGAAGAECLLAVLARLRRLHPDRPVRGLLLTRGDRLVPDLSAAARRALERALARADVDVKLQTDGSAATLQSAGLVLWATGAQAHAWQLDPARRGALAVDEEGFVRIDARLRSASHPWVFAAGDCARWSEPLPKSGVVAVRMGPVLAQNLRSGLGQGAWRSYVPQRAHLSLLSTADGRAIASRGRLGGAGRWAWHWKHRIDQSFVAGFRSSS